MITDQISQWGPFWPPKLPLWIGFPVFARISRVQMFEIGPKCHRSSVSWPYNCVKLKSLLKVGHSILEIWAFVTHWPPKFPLWIGFPVFARISRVRMFKIGPKFHRLSVSWPYNCVKSLKKVGHSSLEVSRYGPLWPPKLPLWIGFPVFARISRVRMFKIGPKFHRLSISWPYNCVKSLKKVGQSSLEIWAFVTPQNCPFG